MAKGRPEKLTVDSYIPVTETGCWLWEGAISSSGYGTKWKHGKALLAHRYVYTELVGPIPKGMQLNHKCDTKICVNPTHMKIGTQIDNVMDMDRRGRRNQTRKLTIEQAKRVKYGDESAMLLAKELNMSVTCINYIRAGTSWRWI